MFLSNKEIRKEIREKREYLDTVLQGTFFSMLNVKLNGPESFSNIYNHE